MSSEKHQPSLTLTSGSEKFGGIASHFNAHLYYSNLIECIRVLSVAFIACTFEYWVYSHNT